MLNYTQSDEKDRFYLHYRATNFPSDGTLGRGSVETTAIFRSDEARRYYILMLQAQEGQGRTTDRFENLRRLAKELRTPTGRIRMKILAKIEEGLK